MPWPHRVIASIDLQCSTTAVIRQRYEPRQLFRRAQLMLTQMHSIKTTRDTPRPRGATTGRQSPPPPAARLGVETVFHHTRPEVPHHRVSRFTSTHRARTRSCYLRRTAKSLRCPHEIDCSRYVQRSPVYCQPLGGAQCAFDI